MQLPAIDRGTARDALRVSLQAGAAAGSTWAIMAPAGLPHVSWAVISAVYVVGQSTSATIKSAMGRTIGTLIGTVVGIACVWLLGGADDIIIRVSVAALVAAALTSFKPDWSYGIVAATVIALEQDASVLDGAIDRALAIILGSGVGTAATLFIMPESARVRARRALLESLQDCETLLQRSLDTAMGEDRELEQAHQSFLVRNQAARAAASTAFRQQRELLMGQLHAVERLWHALIILDRVVSEDWYSSLSVEPELRKAVQRLKEQACRELRALHGRDESDATSGKREKLDDLTAQITRAMHRKAIAEDDSTASIALCALAFAVAEVSRNISELQDRMGTARP